jgi:hypothetical protein
MPLANNLQAAAVPTNGGLKTNTGQRLLGS